MLPPAIVLPLASEERGPHTPFTDVLSAQFMDVQLISAGRVENEKIGRKKALTTLLLVDHLSYCLPRN